MDAGQEDPVMEAEWKRLIFARESGALDAAGHERLEQLVLQDPAARRFYARHLLQTAHLRAWASATSAERQTAGERGGGIGPVILQPAETTTQSSCAPLLGFLQRLPAAIHPVRHPIWFLTAATCLTSIFWLVVMAVISPRGEQAFHPRLPGGAVAHTRFDAMIIRAQDAVWAEDSPSPQVGYALPLERSWMLREGLVQLLFGDGALVVLEGPARFQIDSAGSMSIEQGKMLARAEGRARGFVVRTPVVRLDDLGTEFGLEVAELERETELQVFEGSVQASPGDVRQVPAGYLLRAGDAILFGHTPQHGFYAKEKMMNRNAYLLLASVMLMPVVDGVTTPRTAEALPISLDMVTVGNINNPNDVHGDGFGAVNEEYRIGAYLVTNDQYATFLNAVAANDPFSLYNTNMGSNIRGGITRSGSPGTYTYAAKENMGNKPVNFVSFWDAARFANWLHNGQGAADTENGAYTLTGGASSSNTVDRNTGARFFLPTENGW